MINELIKQLSELPNVTLSDGQEYIQLYDAMETVKRALEQEPKTGHWIKKEYWKPLPYDTEPLDYDNYDEKTHSEKVYHYYCSECDRDEGEIKPIHKYCPNCGCRMVEPQNLKYVDNDTMMPAT